jgi:hypothetical protein
MRKEAIIASFVGVFIGLVVAFGAWRLNSSVKPKNQSALDNNVQITPTLSPQDFKIILAKPEEKEVVTSSPITVSGITQKGSFVLISGETEDFMITSKEDGSFDQTIEPIGGTNQIIINALNTKGLQAQVEVTTVFSTEFAKLISSSKDQPAATPANEGDAIRNKVKEKIEAVRANPKAFIGTVTDKTENSLQIKNTEGDIQFISVEGDVQIVKTTKNQVTIKFNDIAIGDFIVAMGIINATPTSSEKENKGVLLAKRILVTNPLKDPDRKVYFGQVTSNDKKILTINSISGNETILGFSKKWKGPEIKDIKIGNQVVVVSVPENGKEIIRTLYLTEKVK